jgi:hypothetical protein
MSKLKREKALLALNNDQRFALLLTISNFFLLSDLLSDLEFEEFLRAYHPLGKIEDGDLAPLSSVSKNIRGLGRKHLLRR